MTGRLRAEICVLGGGPAGATAALQLAALSHEVLLIEREEFPRPHVGESLAPGIWPQLELLGLRDAVTDAAFPATTAITRWSGRTQTVPGHGDQRWPSLHVDRGRFDSILLRAARDAGARILQPAIALRPRRGDEGWVVPVLVAGQRLEVLARFVVDASGRAARLGGRQRIGAPPTVALHATWTRTGQAWRQARVEAGVEEWFWGAPMPAGRFRAIVFMDVDRYREERRNGTSRKRLYRELLGGSVLLRDLLSSELSADVMACDATSRFDSEPIGDDFLKVGEAAFTVDPLSSSGVQLAVRMAASGGVAVHTMLTRPDRAAIAHRFYADDLADSVRRHQAWAAGYYLDADRGDATFWRRRAADAATAAASSSAAAQPPLLTEVLDVSDRDRIVRLSPDTRFVETACLTGTLIESRRALHHPLFARPIAYFGDIELVPLLEAVSGASPLDGLVAAWSAQLSAQRTLALVRWLLGYGVLVGA